MVFLPPEIEEDPGFYAPVCRARVQACATRILSAIHIRNVLGRYCIFSSWDMGRCGVCTAHDVPNAESHSCDRAVSARRAGGGGKGSRAKSLQLTLVYDLISVKMESLDPSRRPPCMHDRLRPQSKRKATGVGVV